MCAFARGLTDIAAHGCRLAGDDGPWRHVMGDDRARSDDGARAYLHAFENDRAAANPDVVADEDGTCGGVRTAEAVLIGIHDDDVPRDLALAADVHLGFGDHFRVAVEIGATTDEDAATPEDLQPDAGKEGAVLADDLAAVIGDSHARPSWLHHHDAGAGEFSAQ